MADRSASGWKWNRCRLLALAGLVLTAFPVAAAVPGAQSGGSLSSVLANDGSDEDKADLASARPAKKPVRYVWRINDGDKISDAFRAWARQVRQWQVTWEAPELVAQATVDLDGSFEDAVTKVIEALNRNDANLLARFYIDKGNNVLRVMEKK